MFDLIVSLLPRARAWRITTNKRLRQFWQAIADVVVGVRNYADLFYDDIFPQKTRDIDAWEEHFGLFYPRATEQERRDRLAVTWAAQGGQSPRYIQDILQDNGFDVYVHEWWVPGTQPPIPRNPFAYLDDGSGTVVPLSVAGNPNMIAGGLNAIAGSTAANAGGYPLVNKIIVAEISASITAGAAQAVAGNENMVAGRLLVAYLPKQYTISNDASKYPYFLYIGAQIFPNRATIDVTRRNEFEALCLKICPAQQWLGMLVDYA